MIRHNSPGWTSSGEITNSDRFSPEEHQKHGSIPKFLRGDQNLEMAKKVRRLLDLNIKPQEYVYKDVVQPFLVTEWLAAEQYPTIIIHRNPVDVAIAMWQRDWYYPANVTSSGSSLKKQLMTGLYDAQSALATVRGVAIQFEHLLKDEVVIQSALKDLYNSNNIPVVRYLSPAFKEYSKQIDQRKKSNLYEEFNNIYQELKSPVG
ncbi:MAG: hypothetical protein AAFO69_07100 [Bacteroidota bacterium]